MAQRIAVITGGMGGLGESISTKMHDAGYKVVVTYSPGNATADNWVKQMKARDYNFFAFPVDVADFDSCPLLFLRSRLLLSRRRSLDRRSAANQGQRIFRVEGELASGHFSGRA